MLIKNAHEIELLRASGMLVSRTLGTLAPHVVEGATTQELDVIAEEYIRDHGGVPAFKGYRVGSVVFPNTLCISVNSEVVHGIPGDYRLKEGDVVSVDCGVVLDEYYGDSAFTFAVGEISDDVRKLCRITYDALMNGIDAAKAGNRIGDISSAVEKTCQGYGIVRDLVGHGIGRQLHEAPQIPNFGRRGMGKKLKPGMTFCIEPMINLGTAQVVTEPDNWTISSADGSASAHYEHMVAISEGGPQVLTTFSYIEDAVNVPYRDVAAMGEG